MSPGLRSFRLSGILNRALFSTCRRPTPAALRSLILLTPVSERNGPTKRSRMFVVARAFAEQLRGRT